MNSFILTLGNKDIIDLANKLLPVPGGPINNILWKPAALIAKPYFPNSCPFIELNRSIYSLMYLSLLKF